MRRQALRHEVSCVLAEIGRAVEAGVDPDESPACWAAIEAHAAALGEDVVASDVLRRRLHAAWRTSGVLNSNGPSPAPAATAVRTVPLLRLPPVRDAVNTLRANLSFESAAFRHGVRLAVTLASTTALYHAFSLPRGYWVTLTALIVLKPDFQETFARGVGRVAGTVLGATLATPRDCNPSPGTRDAGAARARVRLVGIRGVPDQLRGVLDLHHGLRGVPDGAGRRRQPERRRHVPHRGYGPRRRGGAHRLRPLAHVDRRAGRERCWPISSRCTRGTRGCCCPRSWTRLATTRGR